MVVMASVTWCRPCRAFQEKYEVRQYALAVHLAVHRSSTLWFGLPVQWGRAVWPGTPQRPVERMPLPPRLPVPLSVPQKTAKHYKDAVFLKFYGGSFQWVGGYDCVHVWVAACQERSSWAMHRCCHTLLTLCCSCCRRLRVDFKVTSTPSTVPVSLLTV